MRCDQCHEQHRFARRTLSLDDWDDPEPGAPRKLLLFLGLLGIVMANVGATCSGCVAMCGT